MYELTEADQKLVDEAMSSLRRIAEHKLQYENTSKQTRASLVDDIISLYDNIEDDIESTIEWVEDDKQRLSGDQMTVLRIENEGYLRGLRDAKQMIDDYLKIDKLKSEG